MNEPPRYRHLVSDKHDVTVVAHSAHVAHVFPKDVGHNGQEGNIGSCDVPRQTLQLLIICTKVGFHP